MNYIDFITTESQYLSTIQLVAPTYFVSKIGPLISCVHKAVMAMNIGDISYITCASQDAYGPYGIPNVIAPNTLLFFVMQL